MFRIITLYLSITLVAGQDYYDYDVQPKNVYENKPPVKQTADQRSAPVAILKQINRHNDDGSYTYGFEGADGSFKIETKLVTGEVKGKYGYVDETGKVRIVEYGANKYGFQPSGEGITVAPPTLVDESTSKDDVIGYERSPIVRRPQPGKIVKPIQQNQYTDYDRRDNQPRQYENPNNFEQEGVQYSDQQRPARPDNRPIYSQEPSPKYTPDFSGSQYSQQQTFGGAQSNIKVSAPIFKAAKSFGPPLDAQPLPQQHQYAQPSPQVQQHQYSQPQQAPPQLLQPQYNSNRNYHNNVPQRKSTSILDQLAKDYALPQSNAQPLHDITFGYGGE